jgi:predicted nucleic acid-binding Zn ribbon protein
MNQKKFEIWEKWRTDQCNVELEQLRNDLANRGLSSSSIRNQAEKNLLEKCRAEIAMEKASTEAEEQEILEKNRERKNQLKTNLIIALASIISAAGAFGSFVLAFPQFSKIQVKIDSLQTSIDQLYQNYNQETFSFNQVKDLYKENGPGSSLTLKLSSEPIPQSVNIWWGEMHLNPADFRVESEKVTINFSQSVDIMKSAKINDDGSNEFIVTYIKE